MVVAYKRGATAPILRRCNDRRHADMTARQREAADHLVHRQPSVVNAQHCARGASYACADGLHAQNSLKIGEPRRR